MEGSGQKKKQDGCLQHAGKKHRKGTGQKKKLDNCLQQIGENDITNKQGVGEWKLGNKL